ncbi:MAG: NAD-dependent epimerase/dehydratase family protein [Flavisolibacter sp.]
MENNLTNKKILVTGGAGFVGSNLVKHLVEAGNQVTVLDDFFTGRDEFLSGIDCRIIKGTVADKDVVREAVNGQEIVFHLAARNIIVSNSKPREDLEVNVVGTFNVLEACREFKIERMVYSSTASVYGNPKILPIAEDGEKLFLSFYSASKFSGEVYGNAFFEVFGVPVTIIRYSNVYGYNQSPENPYCGVIGKFLFAALNNQPLQIHGDGEQTRDFTFIEDAIWATTQAAVSPRAIGQTYNIATGVDISVNTLAKQIIEVTGSQSEIRHIDRRDIDNIRRRVLNIEKIRHELQYSPQYTLQAGLKRTFEWMQSHLNLFQ